MCYSVNFKALLDCFSDRSGSTAHLLILRALFGSEITTISKGSKDSRCGIETGNDEFQNDTSLSVAAEGREEREDGFFF